MRAFFWALDLLLGSSWRVWLQVPFCEVGARGVLEAIRLQTIFFSLHKNQLNHIIYSLQRNPNGGLVFLAPFTTHLAPVGGAQVYVYII